MENEYDERTKTTKVQYDLVQKQLNTLNNTYNQTNQKLSSLQTNEINVNSFPYTTCDRKSSEYVRKFFISNESL
jgi:hypothetical protein